MEMRDEGHCAETYARFLGLRVDDSAGLVETGKAYECDDVKVFIFDEICALEPSMVNRLSKMMDTLRGRETPPIMMATGDVHQLPPIETFCNKDVDSKAYVRRLVNNLFPVSVRLQVPKRFKGSGDPALVLKITRMLFEEKRPLSEVRALFKTIREADVPDGARFVTYKKDTRYRLNNSVHKKKYGSLEPFAGLDIVYNSNTRKQGKEKLIRNYTYTVLKVAPHEVFIAEKGNDLVQFALRPSTITNWFTFKHAGTVHSCQGSTYHEPVIVADADFWRVTPEWLYVALTRCSDLSKVFILDTPPRVLDEKAIRTQILRHNATDGEDGGLTVQWWKDALAIQDGQCALCNECMDTPAVGVWNGNRLHMASIDRINSDGTHTPDNCQLVCQSCNFSKKNRL
jgi:hypothetical protein